MSAGATAQSVAYVDAGPITITVSAQASPPESVAPMEVWFDGTKVGAVQVPGTTLTALPFHVEARASGPTALRIVFTAAADKTNTTLQLQKVVVTEP